MSTSGVVSSARMEQVTKIIEDEARGSCCQFPDVDGDAAADALEAAGLLAPDDVAALGAKLAEYRRVLAALLDEIRAPEVVHGLDPAAAKALADARALVRGELE